MGSSSVTGDETILFADNMSFDGTARGGKMTSDGELWIGASSGRRVRKGTLSGANGITIVNGPGTITIQGSGGGGTVTGTGTDNHIVRWDGTGVPIIQDSSAILTDDGEIQAGDGDINSPAYSYVNEPNSGWYRANTFSYNFSIAGFDKIQMGANIFKFLTGVAVPIRTSGDNPVLVQPFDFCVGSTVSTAPRTISLPDTGVAAGQIFWLYDAAGTADSETLTINVVNGVKTISGETSWPIGNNYFSIGVIYDGTNYILLSRT